MIEITKDAIKNILEYFNGKDVTPVRIFMNSSG